MKNFPSTLLAFVQSHKDIGRADLFSIALPNGQTLRATSAQVDLTYSGNVYFSSQNGVWQRGKVTAEAAFDLRANDMSLTVLAPYNKTYPGTTATLMAAALMGLFDAAQVLVYTAYFPAGLNNPSAINAFIASAGVENKYAGYIKPGGNISRSKIEFEVADPLYVLDIKMPRNLIQTPCRHTLYDPNCTLVKTSFQQTNSVAAGSTRQNIILGTAASHASPYFAQGFLTMTSGQNNGFTYAIKSQNGTTSILLANAMPLPLAIGDTFTMYAGCDKTAVTCQTKFNNLINIGSMEFVPNPEVAI